MNIIGMTNSAKLTEAIGLHLNIFPINANIVHFASGEYMVKLDNATHKELIIVGSICSNDNIMELLSIIDGARNAGANDITLIAPYIAYSRQNNIELPYSSVGIKIIGQLLESMKINHVITVDIHSLDSLDFFPMKVTHIDVADILSCYSSILEIGNDIIIAPDKGSKKRLKDYNVIELNKTRQNNIVTTELYHNIAGKNCFIIDDILDSGSTMYAAIEVLRKNKAAEIRGYVTHYLGKFSVPIPLYVTDTATLIDKENFFTKILPISPVICKYL